MVRWIGLAVAAVGLGIVASGWYTDQPAAMAAPLMPAGGPTSGLITHVQELDGKLLRVIMIDPSQRVMGVYEITRDTGEIQIKSIRNFHADFQMLEYNSGTLSPADIQKTLERK